MNVAHTIEIGILGENDTFRADQVTAAEYITDGPSNEWMAPITLADFFDDNADGILEDEQAEIEAALISAGRFVYGGGASAIVTLIRL